MVRILEDIRISKLFCGVSDPGEQHSTTNISEKFEKEFKNILVCEFGDYMAIWDYISRASVPLTHISLAQASKAMDNLPYKYVYIF